MSETVHASCVALGARAVLILGGSGRGKSDLALRLIDRGAKLVSDDYTVLAADCGRLFASPPQTIAGRIELRGVGLVEMEAASRMPVCLALDLDRAPERLPEPFSVDFLGIALPALGLAALEPSAPIKVERALFLFGLPWP